jgi:ribose transport system ATP-binding protein
MAQPLLQATAVAKAFGPVVALRAVDLSVAPGEVHALLGANGAGKSTLVKILTGVLANDSGTVAVNGEPVRLGSPTEARERGLAPVYQDPALVRDLTVTQNLRLTGVDPADVRRELAAMDLDGLDLDEQVRDIPLPFLRMLDLARALVFDPQLLMLDEITAALPPDLSERVFAIMGRWKQRNRSVLFISHRLAEVREHCDMCTVLRDGRDVASFHPGEGGEAQIVATMLGEASAGVRDVARERKAARERDEEEVPRLVVRDLLINRQDAGVSFEVKAGEVLGLAALEGQGQDRLFEILSGNVRAAGGEILVDGQPVTARHPYDAIRRGVVLVPSNRLMALLPQRPIRENIAVPLFNRVRRWGPINAGRERRQVSEAVDRLSIDTRAAAQARRLSGGNQQKLVLGREFASKPKLLIAAHPTRGLDIGATQFVWQELVEARDEGVAVLLISSNLEEILALADRVGVIYDGRIVAQFQGSEATMSELGLYMTGARGEQGEPAA